MIPVVVEHQFFQEKLEIVFQNPSFQVLSVEWHFVKETKPKPLSRNTNHSRSFSHQFGICFKCRLQKWVLWRRLDFELHLDGELSGSWMRERKELSLRHHFWQVLGNRTWCQGSYPSDHRQGSFLAVVSLVLFGGSQLFQLAICSSNLSGMGD